ncbi:dual specificity phosphatase 12 [Mortierella claussenii]|nr:dual specificity phosphatase 12 [Mortierella claussenii]
MFPAKPLFDGLNFREMQEVVPGLFLSGSQPSESREYLNEKGITHIVQVTDITTPRFPGEFIYKIISVPDMDESNLIKHFPDTHNFIHDAIAKGGKVLVHCMAGASRSVTVVCAYLMKAEKMSLSEALAAIQALRSIAEPNDGFMKQLTLYGDIEFDVNVNRTEYRRFLMASMAAQREIFGYIDQDDLILAVDPTTAGAAASNTALSTSLTSSPISALPQRPLKCKKCRRALVARDSVIPHTPGHGQNSFQYRKRDATLHISEPKSTTVCQSYFIEPVEWIQGLGGLDGKIACPKCDSKLGTFNWSGEQCSCGAWVTPAFMLHKGKVDA